MDVDSTRKFCLSMPGAKEKLQWGETLCFKVGEKIFAMLNLAIDADTRLVVKCSPEELAMLLENEGVRRAPYVGRYNWAALERLDSLPDREIRDLISRSYQIIAAKVKAPTSKPKGAKKKMRSRTRVHKKRVP
jgi:predicted DNA-binding protein (MmcQ/YjbR family)